MASRQPTHVTFLDIRSLLLAWHHCLDRSARFPADVLDVQRDSGHAWSTPLGPLRNFESHASTDGWRFVLEEQAPKGNRVRVASLLSGEWRYRDPELGPPASQPSSKNGSISPPLGYEPKRQSFEYVLAARSREEAAGLLTVMGRFLTRSIRAIPMPASTDEEFKYYWVLDESPSLAVLQAAGRAWWGLPTSEKLGIYRQWPYHLCVPDEILRRIDYGTTAGVVLLSKEAPDTLVLRNGSNTDPSVPLVDVADLKAGTVHMATTATRLDSPRFEVRLRLLDGDYDSRLRRRVRELDREISAKQELVKHLKDEANLLDVARDQPPELLFVYPVNAEDTEGEVPVALRRLLIEWSGQAEDLMALRYVRTGRVDSLRPEYTGAHVLTTGYAVGDGTSAAACWMHDYGPTGAGILRYELSAEWLGVGLRLFVPEGRRLDLRPELRPSPATAQKLGEALMGDRRGEFAKSLFLLSDDGALRVWRLDLDRFIPLTDAFGWHCALAVADASETVPHIVASHVERTRTAFTQSIEAALKFAVDGILKHRLSELEPEISSLGTELTRADEFLPGILNALGEYQSAISELKSILATVSRSSEHVRGQAARFEGVTEDITKLERQIGESLNSIVRTREALGKLRRK